MRLCAQGTIHSIPEAVLSGARQMAAVEIMSEPKVRDMVRHAFIETAVFSTGAQGTVCALEFETCYIRGVWE